MTIFQAGDFILNGEFRLEALIGAGAFAEVYRATHIALKAQRAIKVLRHDAPGVGSTEFADYAQRFQLEAQLGARLDHPHVIRVYDFRRDGEMLLLIMEYAGGDSLAEWIERARKSSQPLPIDDVIRIALEVADGLAALHALDVVHRDLKPSNILFDVQDRARISDLGLAQVPGGPSMRSRLSQSVPHPGTPAYMSPEQANTSNHLAPSSDVYALGCIVFEMLTGRLYKNVRPGTHAKTLRADTLEWLDDLVTKMLADDPRERPWDGSELNGYLQSQWDKMSVVPQSTPSQHEQNAQLPDLLAKLEKAREQDDWRLLAEIGQRILLLNRVPDSATSIARSACSDGYYHLQDKAYYESLPYAALLTEIAAGIERAPELADLYWLHGVISAKQCTYRDSNEWSDWSPVMSDFSKAIELDSTHAEYYWQRGLIYNTGYGVPDEIDVRVTIDYAITDLDRAIKLGPGKPEFYFERAVNHRWKDERDLMMADFSSAIQMVKDPVEKARYFAERGKSYEWNVPEGAIADFTRAIELNPAEAAYYNLRAGKYCDQYAITKEKHYYDWGMTDHTKAIELSPQTAQYYSSRGRLFDTAASYDLAIADYTQAIELDPQTGHYYSRRAYSYYRAGDFDHAINDYTQAILLARQTSTYDPRSGDYFMRGECYFKEGDYDQGMADYAKAIELAGKYDRKSDYYSQRALRYAEHGNTDRALDDIGKAIDAKNDSDRSFYFVDSIAWIYRQKNDYNTAIAVYSTAIEHLPTYSVWYRERGSCYAAAGDSSHAEADRSKARELDNP